MKRIAVASLAVAVGLSGCSDSPSKSANAVTGEQQTVAFQPEADKIHVLINGNPFTTYHYEAKWDKPFLHPVRSLSGVEVTRGWPVAPREGESDDHIWHRGLFMGHDRINGVDFWREKGRDKTGILMPRSTPATSTNEGSGTLTAVLDLLTPEEESLGGIRQVFTFSADEDNAFIDVDVRVLADRGKALTMGDTEEGWVGFRFDDAFMQENGATLLNSDGLVGTEDIWGKRAKWVDYSTTLQGQQLGVAIFDHPNNPRHPTYWHARGYGLCTANPFGIRAFTGDESKDGTMEIPEGGELRFRYRFVVHPGSAEDASVEKLYGEYTAGS